MTVTKLTYTICPKRHGKQNLAIANRSCVSCTYNTSRAPITPWWWNPT